VPFEEVASLPVHIHLHFYIDGFIYPSPLNQQISSLKTLVPGA